MDSSILLPIITVFDGVGINTPDVSVIVVMVLTFILILLSGFASGSEIAFFSLSPAHLAELAQSRSKRDINIQQLREDGERTLATILITNNFVNVLIIMLCNYIISQLVDFGNAVWLDFLCKTVILTFILLLFGEIIPKVYSRENPLRFCRSSVSGIMFCRRVFWPLESILIHGGALAGKVIQQDNHTLSVDELEQALEMTDKDTIKDEQNMLEGIIRFGDETVKEVMTSRQDIVDIDIHSSFSEVVKCIVDNNYSRIPVSKDGADDIRGILYTKDLLPYLNKPNTFRWQSLMRPPYFIPETKKLDDLLREFQNNKVHIAIVVDEFGGTSGLVTLEDILEEIVGEINDEYDEEESFFTRLNVNTYVFEGKTLLTDFLKVLNLDDEEFDEIKGESESLAGLMLELKGDFPTIKEHLEYKNYGFEVLELDGRRISKIKVVVHSKQ